jgi:hypothetical protein
MGNSLHRLGGVANHPGGTVLYETEYIINSLPLLFISDKNSMKKLGKITVKIDLADLFFFNAKT